MVQVHFVQVSCLRKIVAQKAPFCDELYCLLVVTGTVTLLQVYSLLVSSAMLTICTSVMASQNCSAKAVCHANHLCKFHGFKTKSAQGAFL